MVPKKHDSGILLLRYGITRTYMKQVLYVLFNGLACGIHITSLRCTSDESWVRCRVELFITITATIMKSNNTEMCWIFYKEELQ